MLPPMDGVDSETARRTVAKVWTTWDWNRCWGWDFPWMAMAAARTGQPQIAVDALLKEIARKLFHRGDQWWLVSAWQWWLALCRGNDGRGLGWAPDRPAPGFPDDGSWAVKWEGLKKAP